MSRGGFMGSRYYSKRIKKLMYKGGKRKVPKAFKTKEKAEMYAKKMKLKNYVIEQVGKTKFKIRKIHKNK